MDFSITGVSYDYKWVTVTLFFVIFNYGNPFYYRYANRELG